jgi:hypothetical protein
VSSRRFRLDISGLALCGVIASSLALTYMSILDEIKAHGAAGRLHRLTPVFPNTPLVRTIWLSTAIHSQFQSPGDPTEAPRWARIRADLETPFIEGLRIPVPAVGTHPNRAFMARMEGYREVWETRHRKPTPSIRLFGRFAAFDLFVALTWGYRKMLGGRDDPRWKVPIRQCITDWQNLFPAYGPWEGDYPHGYLSNPYVLGDP